MLKGLPFIVSDNLVQNLLLIGEVFRGGARNNDKEAGPLTALFIYRKLQRTPHCSSDIGR